MTEFETKLLIDGQFVPGAAGKTFTVTSSLTGEAYAEVASAGRRGPRSRGKGGSARL